MANSTTITGTTLPTATATDPSLCRISGYLKNAKGQPLAGAHFVLRYCYIPLGLSPDTLIQRERIAIRADREGYVEFDLIRGARLTLELPNLLFWVYKELTVPDAASVELLEFLFPYLVSVDWVDPGPITIAVGETHNAKLIGTLSNGLTVDVPGSAATYDSSAPSVLTPAMPGFFRGLSAGVSSVTVTEVDRSAVDKNEDKAQEDLTFFTLPAVVLPAALSVTVTP